MIGVFFAFLFYMALLAAVIILNYFIAKKFEAIAFQKGYDVSIHSFAMCFWLGLVGYLYVIALPNLKMMPSANATFASTSTYDVKTFNNEENEQ